MSRGVNSVVITVARRGVIWHPSGGLPVIVVWAADPVGLGRDDPGPGASLSGSGTVGAVVGQQLLDGLGGLLVQLALPVAGGQTADPGREAADGAVRVDDDDLWSDRVQRPGPPAAAGQGRRQPKPQIDWAKRRRRNADAEQRDRPPILVADLPRRVADEHDHHPSVTQLPQALATTPPPAGAGR